MAPIRLILIFTLLIYQVVQAQDKWMLSVSKSVDKLKVHQSLLITQKKTTLLKNSNAFCPENKKEFFIGHFEAKNTADFEFEKLNKMFKEVNFDKDKKRRHSDHTPLFLLNNKPVTDPIQVSKYLKPSFSIACDLKYWESKDGLRVKIIDENNLEITFLTTNKIKTVVINKECTDQKSRKHCTFPQYGRIYLP